MNADAELDAALRRQAGVALDQAVLHLDGAAHRVDHAAELDEIAVPGALDDAPVMRVDGGIDQIAPQPPEPRQRAILVRAREPAVADNISDQDRRDLPGLGHCVPRAGAKIAGIRRPLCAENEGSADPQPYRGETRAFSPVAKAYPSGTPTFRIIS